MGKTIKPAIVISSLIGAAIAPLTAHAASWGEPDRERQNHPAIYPDNDYERERYRTGACGRGNCSRHARRDDANYASRDDGTTVATMRGQTEGRGVIGLGYTRTDVSSSDTEITAQAIGAGYTLQMHNGLRFAVSVASLESEASAPGVPSTDFTANSQTATVGYRAPLSANRYLVTTYSLTNFDSNGVSQTGHTVSTGMEYELVAQRTSWTAGYSVTEDGPQALGLSARSTWFFNNRATTPGIFIAGGLGYATDSNAPGGSIRAVDYNFSVGMEMRTFF